MISTHRASFRNSGRTSKQSNLIVETIRLVIVGMVLWVGMHSS